MSDNSSQAASGAGVGFFGLLGLIFITLKLCGVINWPWIWVLAPLWGPLVLTLSLIIIIAIVFVVGALFLSLIGYSAWK